MLRVTCLILCTCATATGANWLTARGDAQRTGWQRQEKTLNAGTVKTLHLLWKLKLGGGPHGLTDPLILGPIITHRGIKELIFVRNSSYSVYAIDADLGRIYWQRDLPISTLRATPECDTDLQVMPIMAPQHIKESAESDDEFSDGNKPLYVLARGGKLYAVRPSTGEDFSPPLNFLSQQAHAVALAIAAKALYANTSAVCDGASDEISTLTLNVSESQIGSDLHAQPISGFRGTITPANDGLVAFDWMGEHMVANADREGQIVLHHSEADPVVLSETSRAVEAASLATWEDAKSTRWIVDNRGGTVEALRLGGEPKHPVVEKSWSSQEHSAIRAPVIANGIVYFLSASGTLNTGHLVLHALDALSGAELYSSGNAISSTTSAGDLAMANGHVSFSDANGVVYCFGIPFEM